MSEAAPLRRPLGLRAPAPAAPAKEKVAHPRPRLVLVSQRRPTAGRLPFVIVIGALLVMGLVAVLLLHMMAAQDAYRASALQQQLSTLRDQEQALAGEVDADSSPAALRQRAVALGMRPATVAKYHKLKDGRAVGLQTPIPPPLPPAPVTKSPKTTAKTSATSATKTATKSSTTRSTTTSKSAPATTTTGHTAPKHTAKRPHR